MKVLFRRGSVRPWVRPPTIVVGRQIRSVVKPSRRQDRGRQRVEVAAVTTWTPGLPNYNPTHSHTHSAMPHTACSIEYR